MKNHISWLFTQIHQWIDEGIIQKEQAERIIQRYLVYEKKTRYFSVSMIFPAIGAIICGLGVILFFAYNWESMHKFIKLSIIFSTLIVTHASAVYIRQNRPDIAALGDGLHLFGTMLFGSGIWLIAQIYHISEHYPNAFFIWGMGAILMAWALLSISQGIVASLIMIFWQGFEVFDFQIVHHIAPLVIFIGILLLAFYIKSIVLLFVGIFTLLLSLCFTVIELKEGLFFYIVFFYANILIALGINEHIRKKFAFGVNVFTLFGTLIYLIILYLLCFEGFLKEISHLYKLREFTDIGMMYYYGFLVIVIITWVNTLIPDFHEILFPINKIQSPALPMMVLIGIIAITHGWTEVRGNWIIQLFFNLMFIMHSIFYILHGCQRIHAGLTTLGCVMFIAIVFARYIDLFDSLLMRSLVFILTGMIIFGIGTYYTRAKKQRQHSL
ncbi:MAG: DUF2157 domain-containing protein [Desulfobacterales bacterium]|nr:DUF2157 domain-containing protein [Desulfobacterales bacterium]